MPGDCFCGRSVLADDVKSVYDARNDGQTGQEDIDDQIFTAAPLHQNSFRKENKNLNPRRDTLFIL